MKDDYKIDQKIGEGAYGKVYWGANTKTKEKVALKKNRTTEKYVISYPTIREIKALKLLKSKYIIDLKETFVEKDAFCAILEYMPYDLAGLLGRGYEITDKQFDSFAYQILDAVCFIHKKGYIHRDLKPSNILIDRYGHLKLADFGLTREISANMTNRVCTLWYRAPELLLGATKYDERIDAWSIACIFIEIKTKTPFFKGYDEIEQLDIVFSRLGAPTKEFPFSDLFKLENYKKDMKWEEIVKQEISKYFNDDFLYFMTEMLRMDYEERLSVENAMEFPCVQAGKNLYFPIDFEESHEYTVKKLKKNN